MPPQLKLGVHGVFKTAVMMLLVFSTNAVCQPVPDEKKEPAQADKIEEVIVYGTSLGRLEVKIYRAQEKLFDTFNAFNSDDQYDVHCDYEERVGSRIRQWVCTPNFVKEVTRQAARSFFEGWGLNTNWGTVLIKEQQLLEKMKELVEQHPELREARNELVVANYKFELEKENRKKKRNRKRRSTR